MPEFENTRNPILPPAYHVPDCEAHVMPDGRLYLYGSYDAREDQYCSGEYHVISTPDLAHWTVHETSFRGEWVPWFGEEDAQDYPETQRGKPIALGYATGKGPLGPFTYQGIIIENDGCDP